MAINYSINPYQGGAVVFNMQPYQQFYERQMMRQQAKQDALENYFKDLNKNVTSAGMRSQDVPTLLKKNQDWQQFYQQNKPAILDPKIDGGKAYTQYMSQYQDQLGVVNESKEALKSMDNIGKMKLNPQMSYVFDDPKFMNQIERHELPIGDPNREPINLATATLPTKPIDTKDWDAYNKYLVGGLSHDKIPGQVETLPGFKTRTPIYAQYSTDNLKVIGEHAMNAYDTDKRWRLEANKVFDELKNDPKLYEKYNSVYKSLYGTDIDDPKEAWAAKGIIDNNMKATEFKDGDNTFAREQALMRMRQANAKELIAYRKQVDPSDTDMNNTWVESYLNQSMNEAKQSGKPHIIYNGKDIGGRGYEISANPVLMKAFSRGQGSSMREPDRIYVTEDNKILPIFYKYGTPTDANGNVIKGKEKESTVLTNKSGHPLIDEDYSRPMSIDHAKLALGYKGQTKKQLSETMQSKSKPQKNSDPLGLF